MFYFIRYLRDTIVNTTVYAVSLNKYFKDALELRVYIGNFTVGQTLQLLAKVRVVHFK